MNKYEILFYMIQFKSMPEAPTSENIKWIQVLNFLQKQHIKISMQEQQWNFERQSLLDKINRLQAELDSNKVMIVNLLNRIKLLEIALFEEKSAKSKNKQIHQQNQLDFELQNLISKYQLEGKVRDEGHQTFLKKILVDMGIDSKQVIFQQKKSHFFQEGTLTGRKKNQLLIKEGGKIIAHLDSVRGLMKTNVSDALVTISEDCSVKMWSYKQVTNISQNDHLEPLKTFREHTGPLFAITGGKSPFNPEESIFFTGGSEGLVKYWKINNTNFAESGVALGYMNNSIKEGSKNNEEESGVIWSLSLHNNKLLSTSSDGFVRMFEVGEQFENENEYEFFVRSYKESQYKATSVAWLTEGSFIHGCSNAPRGQLWDAQSNKVKQIFMYDMQKGKQANTCQINQIKYSPVTKILSFGCQDGFLRLYSPNYQKMVRKIELSSSINCIECLNQWNLIAGTSTGNLSIWDLRTYQIVKQFKNTHLSKYEESLTCLLRAQAETILSGGAEGAIKIYK